MYNALIICTIMYKYENKYLPTYLVGMFIKDTRKFTTIIPARPTTLEELNIKRT